MWAADTSHTFATEKPQLFFVLCFFFPRSLSYAVALVQSTGHSTVLSSSTLLSFRPPPCTPAAPQKACVGPNGSCGKYICDILWLQIWRIMLYSASLPGVSHDLSVSPCRYPTACIGICQGKMMQLPWFSLCNALMAGVAPQAPCRPRGRWGQWCIRVYDGPRAS